MKQFFRAGHRLLRVADVVDVDVTELADYRALVRLEDGRTFELVGPDAIELVLVIKPSALEGRRLRGVRHAWALHNLIGHPGMQILTWLHKPKWGLHLHEMTTPRPASPGPERSPRPSAESRRG